MQAFEYVAAESLGEAISLLDKHGNQARILSGGTDLIVQVRENRRQVDLLVDIKKFPNSTRFLTMEVYRSGLPYLVIKFMAMRMYKDYFQL